MDNKQKQPENLQGKQEEARSNPWNQGNVRLYPPGVNWMRREPPGLSGRPPVAHQFRHIQGDSRQY